MDKTQFAASMLGRLDTIVMLLLEGPTSEGPKTLSDKMRRLLALGLKPSEVAEIVHRPVEAVTSMLSREKTRARNRRPNNGGRKR